MSSSAAPQLPVSAVPGYCFLVHCSKGKYARVIMEAGGWEWFQSLLQVGAGTPLAGSTSKRGAARWVVWLDQGTRTWHATCSTKARLGLQQAKRDLGTASWDCLYRVVAQALVRDTLPD